MPRVHRTIFLRQMQELLTLFMIFCLRSAKFIAAQGLPLLVRSLVFGKCSAFFGRLVFGLCNAATVHFVCLCRRTAVSIALLKSVKHPSMDILVSCG